MNQIANAAGRVLCALALAGLATGCREPIVTLEPSGPALVVRKPALYPETIEYDAARERFLLGSFRGGGIYAVKRDGSVTVVVDDPRLCSVLGIAVDSARNRVWAVSSDLGASAKPSAAGPKQLATVAAYDLTTGEPLHYVDVAPLHEGPHLLNGIALDAAGNAYVSDSFAPVLYEVDVAGHASVFLRSEQFSGDGINLNGLVVHPDGFLLMIKKSDGSLFKVPLANPAGFSKVRTDRSFIGGDGLTLCLQNRTRAARAAGHERAVADFPPALAATGPAKLAGLGDAPLSDRVSAGPCRAAASSSRRGVGVRRERQLRVGVRRRKPGRGESRPKLRGASRRCPHFVP